MYDFILQEQNITKNNKLSKIVHKFKEKNMLNLLKIIEIRKKYLLKLQQIYIMKLSS